MRLGNFLIILGTTSGNIIQFDYDAGQELEIVRRKGLIIEKFSTVGRTFQFRYYSESTKLSSPN